MRCAFPRCFALGFLLAAACLLLGGASPKERPTQQQMEQAERARAAEQAAQQQAAARAAAADAEAQRLGEQRVAAAARLHEAEAATEAAASRMEELRRRRREAAAALAARAETMQPLLPLVERLSLYPAETMLAVPAAPENTLRGVIVLQGIARQVQAESVALRRDQAALEAATDAMRAEQPKLAAAQAAQQQEAAALDQQIAAAQASRDQASADAEAAASRAADDAARAETLRSMLATLEAKRREEAARAAADAARAVRDKRTAEAEAAQARQRALSRPSGGGSLASAGSPRGQLTAPVAGSVFRSWGEATDAGPATGISYRAAPAARVVSPCGGRVVFAAPFRSYGQLLIVDCGGGYHAVLAGFDRLDARPGQSVSAGEPVGVMPGWEPGAGARPSLYIELRHDGQPVNPAPWLKANG